ncbi:MAG: DEAD/DEAH box helicase [Verrucomicrobia subdivision 3 bacterium]|nr:DEAD/DEAH box helicase [Limisphaerales bacterium]
MKQDDLNLDVPPTPKPHELFITLDYCKGLIRVEWVTLRSRRISAELIIRCTGENELTWELQPDGISRRTTHDPDEISGELARYAKMLRVDPKHVLYGMRKRIDTPQPGKWAGVRLPLSQVWQTLHEDVLLMVREMGQAFKTKRFVDEKYAGLDPVSANFLRKLDEQARKEAELQQRIREGAARIEKARKEREAARLKRASDARVRPPAPQSETRPPIPSVEVQFEMPALQIQETFFPASSLSSYFLQERAALWWVSNQSDDLLSLPFCRIERLEYQLRTALRVIGPLRGRALLSDEVGLGKTIEAGLVLKEYLTRGMVQRFLVLTVPSLIDQWEEELEEKFQIQVATTNHPEFREAGAQFWAQHGGIVGSLHTLKLQSHLAVAQTVKWDLLIVDEAHYLRNRSSHAWQAINALPRQFLLLLTATPVQNSLEELYNLVTLLQPGQLPAPGEFRKRFLNKERPHEPREPEELRRLLGQVMIRNTRANAGVKLPPRRAETVLFDPEPTERQFWEMWDAALRLELAQLATSQASMWGRMLLQAAGSSPEAWREALKSFPNSEAARSWSEAAPLSASWTRKCDSVVPLSRLEGGVVVFTQFLHTQAALARHLIAAQVPAFIINGQTPAAERQPITEQFRKAGGALLLTHSGTEGRNLQFSHQLVNFDLPWNPMEIEQRIGRLHRLGQQHPVRIYNFVQAGTLQEHLLEILQDKLNLFELVVGETGLILGERFSSDEFAEEVFRRWRDSQGDLANSMQTLGNQLADARDDYAAVQQLDQTLFAKDYES